jgi:hypothetical protein
MTISAIVTPGQAMAMTPTMTPKAPSKINEVDVHLNMTDIPFLSNSGSPSLGAVPRCVVVRGGPVRWARGRGAAIA